MSSPLPTDTACIFCGASALDQQAEQQAQEECPTMPVPLEPDRAQALIDHLRSDLQEEEARNGELRIQLARAMEWRAQCLRLTQQIEHMQAAQDEFVHAVSHDLRAPLRHVTSYGGLVREALADIPHPSASIQEAVGFVNTMCQSAQRMGVMLEGLMSLAHVSRAPLQCLPIALAGALEQARQKSLDRAARLYGRAAGAVQWSIAKDLPVVQADPQLLPLLLEHLLDNALKFTKNLAAPRIGVYVQHAPTGGWEIVIQDNGVGFDPARAHTLLHIFQRLHREADFAGVGAGLAVCQRIAQRHGASLSIQGALGQGCVVSVQWPLHVPSSTSTTQDDPLVGMGY